MATNEVNFKSVIVSSAVSLLFTVLGAIIFMGITKTDQAAPRDYVDKRFEVLEQKLDKKADKNDIVEIKATLTTMDARLYDLWATSQANKNN